MSYYWGRGTERDLPKAIAWLEKAAAQNHSTALLMLGLCYQHSNSALSEDYFRGAKAAAWSSPPDDGDSTPAVGSLSVSDHFAKWHYLNFHQHITDGFRDAGRRPLSSRREVIVIVESDSDLQRFVSEAQKRLALISGSFEGPHALVFGFFF